VDGSERKIEVDRIIDMLDSCVGCNGNDRCMYECMCCEPYTDDRSQLVCMVH
jgi:hypothetical protein